jgi:hypothetical protein
MAAPRIWLFESEVVDIVWKMPAWREISRCPKEIIMKYSDAFDILPAAWLTSKDEWWPSHIARSAWLEHTPFAAWLVPKLAPKVIVELGTHLAVSYMAFCQANARLANPAKCFAVDTWQGDEHAGKYDSSVFQEVTRLNSQYDRFSTLLRGRFDEALPNFPDGTVDLLHIDGFHTYEAVSKDFHSWLPKMSQRGVMLFHDTAVRERDFGVWRLWGELSQRYPHFDFSHGHGLGVLIVGAEAPKEPHQLCALMDDRAAKAKVRKFFSVRGREVSKRYEEMVDMQASSPLLSKYSRKLKKILRKLMPRRK